METKETDLTVAVSWRRWQALLRRVQIWLPSRGNVLFVLLVLGGLLWAGKAGAFPLSAPTVASDSTTTISYQGRLSDGTGAPVTSSGIPMQFRVYNVNTGGSPLWSETQVSVPVDAGVFHVLLGSTTPIPVSLLASNTNLWLGITVGADSEMTPREQVASVPYAMVASSVVDGSITTSKMADGSVTKVKLGADVSFLPPDGSITTSKIAPHGVSEVFFLAPTTSDTLQPGTNWTDIRDTALTFTLRNQASVFFTYSINVGPNGAPGADYIGTRMLVDGTAYPATGSHYQPYSSGDSNVNLNGNLVLMLPPGDHVVKLQWRHFGNTISFGTDPAWVDGNIGGRTIAAIAFYR